MRIANANNYSYSYHMTTPTTHTLTSPPVAALLARLYADDGRTAGVVRQLFGALTPEERTRRMSDPDADYRAFYGRMKDVHLAVSPETGRLLYLLARANRAQAIVEFGTSFGLSTIHLAAALRDNGGGRLIGSELEPSKAAHARANLATAGLADLVDIREGDALDTLARDLPETIDLVLLDGHKPLYARILAFLEPRLRTGACLVADNADASPAYLARVRDAGAGYLSVPFAADVELSIKL
jgi:predicted O-methyltransferase YrrM